MTINPIGFVKNSIAAPTDDKWGEVISKIELVENLSEDTLKGLIEFSHVEIIYYFHNVDDSKICFDARHPRNNSNWPLVGIFAQRGKNRPNKIGATICTLLNVKEKTITIKGLDAINKTPVFDIKPVFKEYLPKEVRQPLWVNELMKNYW